MPTYKFKARDHNQKDIVRALKLAGWRVYEIGKPVDLLLKKGRIIGCIEVKNKDGRDKLQDCQEVFLSDGGSCGIAYTPEGAIALAESFR